MLVSIHHHYSKKRVLTFAVIFFSAVVLLYWLDHHISLIEAELQALGHWAGIGFIVLFVILTPMFFSVDILCVIAGALFSLSDAILYVLSATMIAAAVIFFLGRSVAQEKAQHALANHPKMAVYVDLIDQDSFKLMFLLRLLPFPFALLSYVFALSKTRFLPYWIATTGIFFYNTILVYFGFLAAHVGDRLNQAGSEQGPHNVLIFAGLLASLVVIGLITKIAKHEIAQLHPSQS